MSTNAPHHAAARTVARMAIHVDRARGGQSPVIGGFTGGGGLGGRRLCIGIVQIGLVRIGLMIMHMVPKVL
ncbi:MAG: hypothetical protein Q8N13_01320 [Acidovorax sp.]|nr:hypothetical protein [Acidovorax sp.]